MTWPSQLLWLNVARPPLPGTTWPHLMRRCSELPISTQARKACPFCFTCISIPDSYSVSAFTWHLISCTGSSSQAQAWCQTQLLYLDTKACVHCFTFLSCLSLLFSAPGHFSFWLNLSLPQSSWLVPPTQSGSFSRGGLDSCTANFWIILVNWFLSAAQLKLKLLSSYY